MELTYIDECGNSNRVEFEEDEYHNLMMLLFDKYGVDWGDCKGRAWCGTCHIEVCQGTVSQKIETDEREKLAELEDVTERSRLACQLLLRSDLDKLLIRIVGE
jgi:2Fe-2S ferredoxin